MDTKGRAATAPLLRPSVHSINVAQSPAIPAGQVLNVEVNEEVDDLLYLKFNL